MINISMLLIVMITFIISGCSAPKPPKVSFTRNLKPVNFNNDKINYGNVVIKSEQPQNCWNMQFIYSIDNQDYSPKFFYVIAHADKIVARIKPPFIDFVFEKTKSNLKSYGVTAQIELLVIKDDNQDSQVILECIKYQKACNT